MPAAAQKTPRPPRELKSDRLELRVTPSVKKIIQQAMAVTGLAAGDLAYEGARRLLAEQESMVLTGEDRDVFFAALANPPMPSPALIEAGRRSLALRH